MRAVVHVDNGVRLVRRSFRQERHKREEGMATECPNCGHEPEGGLLGGSWFWVYQCDDCGKHSCHRCGTNTSDGLLCAHCESENTKKSHEVHKSD